MSSKSSVESVVEDVTAFLDEASEKVEPERDIPRGEGIGRSICTQWIFDDDAWHDARNAIAGAVTAHFAGRPDLWARIIHLIARYLDDLRLGEPKPRHDGQARIFTRGNPVYLAELGLAQAVAGGFLAQVGGPGRERLFETLTDWDAWEATSRALAASRPTLDEREILALMTHALRFTRGGSAADLVLEPIREGLRGSMMAVDTVLDGWLAAVPPYADANARVIGTLARWRLPDRTDGSEVRQRLIRQFARLPMEHGGHEALIIAFRSWPPDAALVERQTLLLEALDRTGPAGGAAALTALAFDQSTPTLDGLTILDAIVARSDAHDARTSFGRLRALQWIAQGLNQLEEPSTSTMERARTLVERLPPPTEISLNWMRQLDSTLKSIAAHAPAAVQEYALDWLEVHHSTLEERGETPAQALPSTWGLLPGFDWLIEAVVSPRPARRRAALRYLLGSGSDSRNEHPQIPSDAFRVLTQKQVKGLAHMILSQARLGEATVSLLFALARARLDCLDDLSPLLDRPAMQTYPGRHERCVDEWALMLSGRPDDPESRTVRNLQEAISVRRQGFEARGELRRLLFDHTRPTAGAVRGLLNRLLRVEVDRNQSALRAVATKIPIACGEAWNLGDASEQASPFQQISWEMEGLALDAYDPIAARFARVDHERTAQALLGGQDDVETKP